MVSGMSPELEIAIFMVGLVLALPFAGAIATLGFLTSIWGESKTVEPVSLREIVSQALSTGFLGGIIGFASVWAFDCAVWLVPLTAAFSVLASVANDIARRTIREARGLGHENDGKHARDP